MDVPPAKFKPRQYVFILGLGTLGIYILFLVVPYIIRAGYTRNRNPCGNRLRQIDGAKQQRALENQKRADDTPTSMEVAAFLRDNRFPVCPAGGSYIIGHINEAPRCSRGDSTWPDDHVLNHTNDVWRDFRQSYSLLLGLRPPPALK